MSTGLIFFWIGHVEPGPLFPPMLRSSTILSPAAPLSILEVNIANYCPSHSHFSTFFCFPSTFQKTSHGIKLSYLHCPGFKMGYFSWGRRGVVVLTLLIYHIINIARTTALGMGQIVSCIFLKKIHHSRRESIVQPGCHYCTPLDIIMVMFFVSI